MTDLIAYGSVLYWALLLLSIYVLTVLVCKMKTSLGPNMWAGGMIVAVFAMTSYSPQIVGLMMFVVAYVIIGIFYCTARWIKLLAEINRFISCYEPISISFKDLRYISNQAFQPNDTSDECLTIPPDPREFRTRLWLWFAYWPCFALFGWLFKIHQVVSDKFWNLLDSITRKIYRN